MDAGKMYDQFSKNESPFKGWLKRQITRMQSHMYWKPLKLSWNNFLLANIIEKH